MRGWIVAMVVAGAATGWAAPEVRTLAKGALCRVTRPGERVISTADGWQKLWDEHTRNANPKPLLPAVDFSKEMVLAVFMGQRPTTGYAIDVTGVTPGDKAVVVSVRRTSPPPGAITGQIITSPFVFVAAPRSDRPVKFITSDVAGRT
jgi:PrcB C-terminal